LDPLIKSCIQSIPLCPSDTLDITYRIAMTPFLLTLHSLHVLMVPPSLGQHTVNTLIGALTQGLAFGNDEDAHG